MTMETSAHCVLCGQAMKGQIRYSRPLQVRWREDGPRGTRATELVWSSRRGGSQ